MKKQIRSYEDLDVWRDAIGLVKSIYTVTGGFPIEERYVLTSQMKRSSISVPSNIAEGHKRASTREFLRFLSIARGSLGELDTQIVIANELDLCLAREAAELRDELRNVRIRLFRLAEALKRKS